MAGSESSNDMFLNAEARRLIESKIKGVYRCMMKSDGMHARGVSIRPLENVEDGEQLAEESGVSLLGLLFAFNWFPNPDFTSSTWSSLSSESCLRGTTLKKQLDVVWTSFCIFEPEFYYSGNTKRPSYH